MPFSECMQLKAIAEEPDTGDDKLRFNKDVIGDFLEYMDNMKTWCENISRMAESRIRKVIDK